MGSIAHFRQAMLDSDHLAEARCLLRVAWRGPSARRSRSEGPAGRRAKKLPVWWEANTRDEIHRALDLAEEFGTTAVIVGGREAGKVVDRLKASNVPVVLRLNFPVEPKVPTEEEYQKKPRAERDEPLRLLAHRKSEWKKQVGTAAALAKAGVPFAFSAEGIDRIDSFPGAVRQLITAGLSADEALAGLTQNAAEIGGVGRRLGTLEPGKLGHLIVMTAPFSDEKSKVRYVLVDGLSSRSSPRIAPAPRAAPAVGTPQRPKVSRRTARARRTRRTRRPPAPRRGNRKGSPAGREREERRARTERRAPKPERAATASTADTRKIAEPKPDRVCEESQTTCKPRLGGRQEARAGG